VLVQCGYLCTYGVVLRSLRCAYRAESTPGSQAHRSHIKNQNVSAYRGVSYSTDTLGPRLTVYSCTATVQYCSCLYLPSSTCANDTEAFAISRFHDSFTLHIHPMRRCAVRTRAQFVSAHVWLCRLQPHLRNRSRYRTHPVPAPCSWRGGGGALQAWTSTRIAGQPPSLLLSDGQAQEARALARFGVAVVVQMQRACDRAWIPRDAASLPFSCTRQLESPVAPAPTRSRRAARKADHRHRETGVLPRG
jgi:hypothetical protein